MVKVNGINAYPFVDGQQLLVDFVEVLPIRFDPLSKLFYILRAHKTAVRVQVKVIRVHCLDSLLNVVRATVQGYDGVVEQQVASPRMFLDGCYFLVSLTWENSAKKKKKRKNSQKNTQPNKENTRKARVVLTYIFSASGQR